MIEIVTELLAWPWSIIGGVIPAILHLRRMHRRHEARMTHLHALAAQNSTALLFQELDSEQDVDFVENALWPVGAGALIFVIAETLQGRAAATEWHIMVLGSLGIGGGLALLTYLAILMAVVKAYVVWRTLRPASPARLDPGEHA